MVTFHQNWSWQKVIFQVDYLKIGGKIGDFVKYMDFAYKANCYTSQMSFRTCLHWLGTVTLTGFAKGHFGYFT